MAGFLHTALAMLSLAPAQLASRFVEPLAHPWAVMAGFLVSTPLLANDASVTALRLAWRLLHLLLAL
jgi:hypothetical protein